MGSCGQQVISAPVDPAKLEVGDIVLARVAGTVTHTWCRPLTKPKKRVQVSNNRGRVNGWTGYERVFGICVSVDGVPRPGADGKTVAAGRRLSRSEKVVDGSDCHDAPSCGCEPWVHRDQGVSLQPVS
jgi:hypothetical protein